MATIDKVVPIYVEDEMRNSYIDYSMSVIVSRALPDVRDGLKPVHRRILVAMRELNLLHDRPFRKSAKITGDVTARKRLEIHAPGKVYGNISVPSLVIHEGVVFEGQCTMGGPDAQRVDQARKVSFFSKDERPGDGLSARSEIAK